MRGILILAVILDHNDIVRNVRSVQDAFLPMTFHVTGFLFLPFLLPRKELSWGMVVNYGIRYLVPFLVALICYSLAFKLVYLRELPDLSWAKNLAVGATFADTASLQSATGFVVLWFLPALFSTVLLIAWFDCVQMSARIFLIILTTAIHLGVGFMPNSIKAYAPQGILIAAYIFLLGLIVRYAAPRLLGSNHHSLIGLGSLAALCLCWTLEYGTEVEVATLVLPDFRDLLWVIANDLSDISFFILLLICRPFLLLIPGLAVLGQYSLLIYLFHPILYKPILSMLLIYCRVDILTTPAGVAGYWAGAALSVVLVSTVSLAAAAAFMKLTWFKQLVVPRDLHDWTPNIILRSSGIRRS